ncbi:AI-2E family transporter [Paracoccus sp. Z118]|nr:AI-2E family transporter [Paracoccus sp. Z118]MBV0893279.1 AI-2E family transporter [Paracoccus sp. Z118]
MALAAQHEKLLGAAALLVLGIGCFVVISPFLTAIMWAAVLCWSTWPVYRHFERTLGGRRGPAAALMTITAAIVIVAPFALLVAALAESVGDLVRVLGRVVEEGPPGPPMWIGDLPIVGESIASYWQSLALDAPAFLAALRRFTGPAADAAMAGGAFIGVGLLELAFSVFIAFFFYLNGRQIGAYGTHSSGSYSLGASLVAEVVLTMMFLFIIMGATHGRAPVGFAPIAIGLGLTLIHLISIPVTNTSVNPARSTGPALFVGGWALGQLWLFWVAPLIGGALGGALYRFVSPDPAEPVVGGVRSKG